MADPQRPLSVDLSRADDVRSPLTPRTVREPSDDVRSPLTGRPRVAGCIVADPGARRVLCGKRSKAVPTTWAPFVVRAVRGHDPLWCEACVAIYMRLGET